MLQFVLKKLLVGLEIDRDDKKQEQAKLIRYIGVERGVRV